MKDTIVTIHPFPNGEIGLQLEDSDGEVVAVRASRAEWRSLIRMLTHTLDVGELNYVCSPTHPYVLGSA